jgi:hypothetical protein
MILQYSKYGYTFKAQQMDTGDWCACGHAAGKKPYVLHKLGSRLTEEDMQKALVSWAKHVLAVPVRVPAVMSPEGAAIELELFPLRVGVMR